jgi:hypothetical protein
MGTSESIVRKRNESKEKEAEKEMEKLMNIQRSDKIDW